MSEFNDDKIKKAMESQEVPNELSPENIKLMLDEKAPKKKREKITHKATKIAAGAAACAVICGTGAYFAEQGNLFNKDTAQHTELIEDTGQESEKESISETAQTINPYMASAESYSQLYTMLGEAYENVKYRYEDDYVGGLGDYFLTDGAVEENAVEGTMAPGASTTMPETDTTNGTSSGIGSDNDTSHSETYNQEEGVLEADIAKTDGEFIYYLSQKYSDSDYGSSYPVLYSVKAENGTFAGSCIVDVSDAVTINLPDNMATDFTEVYDMYLYNDMLVVIGYAYSYEPYTEDGERIKAWYDYGAETQCDTFVAFYTTGETPQLIDVYSQEGAYNDVRITPDGFMYLITETSSESYEAIESSDDIDSYIPTYTVNGDVCRVQAGCILLPDETLPESDCISYTMIGSLDLNTPGTFSTVDIKAIAGYTGDIYCSGSNLYTAWGYDETEITRISLENGMITPAASGTVKGYIKDQFSMSEYNGYFRVATTTDTWNNTFWDEITGETDREINNHLYVLDMELNQVGHITDFGIGETIKSAIFARDMAYVVTYEQTDPLFSIDLSNPNEPVILDEYKIFGYSSYMQQWSEGLLLGFGPDADENGIENGVKLVMFDNSDPNNLNEVGVYAVNYGDNEWLYSQAVWERKALLIAPEKNLVGFPVDCEYYGSDDLWHDESKYMFFSYDNGEFTFKGELTTGSSTDFGNANLNRAIYIGDYVYALSGDMFIAADIETLTVTDKIEF